MQLETTPRTKYVLGRLKAAACMLLASGAPAIAQTADAPPTKQLDVTGLVYSERVSVVEPTVRFTRLFPNGQSFFGQLVIDSITGASPRGSLPSGQTQTVTSASGNVTTLSAGEIPMRKFMDTRLALDGEWLRSFKSFTPTIGGHFSREKDYQSLGINGKTAFDFDHRLTTLTVGAGFNRDEVFPVGGTTGELADPSVIVGTGSNSKQVTSAMLGVSRVLTRRWIMGITGSFSGERGYLTEPYKILSLVDATTGMPTGDLTEKRPSSRSRTNILTDSVYHFTTDVLYLSYRYYWDDWSVRSHTLDFKFRHQIDDHTYFEPHLRYYTQTEANFFTWGLVQGRPIPDFATTDYRLGPLDTVTIGATIGFRPRDYPGEWSVRAEYLGQYGKGHPGGAVGVQRQYDLYPGVNVFSLVIGYSLAF